MSLQRKLVITAVAAGAAATAGPLHAATEVEILVDDAYKPYTYNDDSGAPTGIYVRVLEEIDGRLDEYDIVLKGVPWKRAMQQLENGTAFAAAPPYYFPEERPWIHPYSEKILEEAVVAYCREEVLDTPRPDWPEDYAGLTVGNNDGFQTPGPEFFEMVDAGEIELQEASSTELNLRKLAMGRVDCYVNARASVLSNLAALKAAGEYDPNLTPLKESAVVNRNWGYVGFSRTNTPDYKEDFVKALNSEIRKMRTSGRIEDIFLDFLAQ